MRRLVPPGSPDVVLPDAVADESRPPHHDRPWLLANLVVALDGGIEVDGRSGPLSSPADRAMFHALRTVADAVVVGASTARDERYRLPEHADWTSPHPAPRLCVVSRSLELDPGLPFLAHATEAERTPVIVTTAASDPARRAALADRCTVIAVDGADVTAASLTRALHDLGCGVVLCEGGPHLLGQLGAAGLVDEWNLTISPRFAGGGTRRLSAPHTAPLGPWRLDRLFSHDDHLFARYLTR